MTWRSRALRCVNTVYKTAGSICVGQLLILSVMRSFISAFCWLCNVHTVTRLILLGCRSTRQTDFPLCAPTISVCPLWGSIHWATILEDTFLCAAAEKPHWRPERFSRIYYLLFVYHTSTFWMQAVMRFSKVYFTKIFSNFSWNKWEKT